MSHDQCKPCGDHCGLPYVPSMDQLIKQVTSDLEQVLKEQQEKKMAVVTDEFEHPEMTSGRLTEVQLIGVLIQNLTGLTKTEAKRVIEYAERLYEDKFGKDKVYR